MVDDNAWDKLTTDQRKRLKDYHEDEDYLDHNSRVPEGYGVWAYFMIVILAGFGFIIYKTLQFFFSG